MSYFFRIMPVACLLLHTSISLGVCTVGELRCENRVNPDGIDQVHPRLSWLIHAPNGSRGISQIGCQVIVASTAAKLAADQGDLWDSGPLPSNDSVYLPYGGKPLASRDHAFWKVRITDQSGDVSPWSAPATFSMGILESAEWKGQWIGAFDREVDDETGGNGYLSAGGKSPSEQKWVQVDLGQPVKIDMIALHPAIPLVEMGQSGWPGKSKFRLDVFPSEYRVDVSDTPGFEHPRKIGIGKHEPPDSIYFKPRHTIERIDAGGAVARYVRVTATMLWNIRMEGHPPFGFGLGQLQVFSRGQNVALNKQVTASDSYEKDGWGAAELTDGHRLINPLADETANAAILFRKKVSIAQKPVRATAYVCGLGYYELSINGKKVGDHVLDPGYTDFSKRVLYVTYDVTDHFAAGDNAIGATIGNGWYRIPTPENFGFERAPWRGPNKLLLEIVLEYADGTTQTVISDPTWKWSTGPITYNCIRGGDTIDARLEKTGWDTPTYDDSGWKTAIPMPAPPGRLVAQHHPPIRVHELIKPVKLTEPQPGVYVYDLGVNISGWAKFQTSGAPGQKVTLHFNEVLHTDGTVDTGHCAYFSFGRFQEGILYCSGKPLDIYEPHFTYHGFRYVEVRGLTHKPALEDLTGCWVTTDPESDGEFSCSNDIINRIVTTYRRTQLNNLHGIPTDCPTREKLGWLEDGTTTEEAAIFNFRMNEFYTKWFEDMQDVQDTDGHVGPIVPTAGWGKGMPKNAPGTYSGPWWGGSVVRTPWNLYEYYGDRRLLESAYPAMKAYVDYMTSTTANSIIGWGLGDWLDESADNGLKRSFAQRKASMPLTSTAAYFYYASIVSKAAKILGNEADADKYSQLATLIAKRYNETFLKNPDTGEYAPDSQTAQALSLALGLVPDDKKQLAENVLVHNILEDRHGHLNSGIVGTLYVFHALEQMNRNDVAYAAFANPGYPGLPYMLEKGGTTFWETWNLPNGMSNDHPALAAPVEWLFRGLAGIRPDDGAPGFKHIILKPAVVGDLTWVKASYRSLYGDIKSDWTHKDGELKFDFTIPPNTTATVFVPTTDPATVREAGQPVANAFGIKPVASSEKDVAVFEVGSGRYVFTSAF